MIHPKELPIRQAGTKSKSRRDARAGGNHWRIWKRSHHSTLISHACRKPPQRTQLPQESQHVGSWAKEGIIDQEKSTITSLTENRF